MIETQKNEQKKLDNNNTKSSIQDEKINEYQEQLQDEQNKLIDEMGKLEIEKSQATMKLITKQTEITKFQEKQREICQTIIKKQSQISSFEDNSISSSLFFPTQGVKIYSESYYQLNSEVKQVIMKKQILSQVIKQLEQEKKIDKELIKNIEDKKALDLLCKDKQNIIEELKNIKEEYKTLQIEKLRLVQEIQEEKEKVSWQSQIAGNVSKLYNFLESRHDQILLRIQSLNDYISQIKIELSQIKDQEELAKKAYEKERLEDEKLFAEKEKIVVEEEMQKEKERLEGNEPIEERLYTENYYQEERLYEESRTDSQVVVIEINEFEYQIQFLEWELKKINNDTLKEEVELKIQEREKQIDVLQKQKIELFTEQEKHQKLMSKQKQQQLSTSQWITQEEQYIILSHRYSQLSSTLKTLFLSETELQEKIALLYKDLSESSYLVRVEKFDSIKNYQTQLKELDQEENNRRLEQEQIIVSLQQLIEELEQQQMSQFVEFSKHYYELQSNYYELTISYQTTLKRIYEHKLFVQNLTMVQGNNTQQINILNDQINSSKQQLIKISENLNQTLSQIEIERINTFEQTVNKNFSSKLHGLKIEGIDLKSEFIKQIITMKVISMMKSTIYSHTEEILTEISSNNFSEIKLQSFELLAMNSFDLKLDKECINLNEDQIKLFYQIKENIFGLQNEITSEINEKNKFLKTIQQIEHQQKVHNSQLISKEQASLEKELLSLTTYKLNITQQILKNLKIVTIIKQEITVINEQEIKNKFEIQKVIENQYQIKIEMGISMAELESQKEQISKMEELRESQQELSDLKQKYQVSNKKIQVLNKTYSEFQTKIDSLLIHSNSISQRLIEYKKQQIEYESEQKELEEELINVQNEQNNKEVEIQNIRSDQLEQGQKNIEELRDEIKDKKIERDVACNNQTIEEDNQQNQVINSSISINNGEAKSIEEGDASKGASGNNTSISEEEGDELKVASNDNTSIVTTGQSSQLDQAYSSIDHSEEYDNSIPRAYMSSNEYKYHSSQKQKQNEYEQSWDQFLKERKETNIQRRKNSTLAKPQKKEQYVKQENKEGVYRIKHKIHDLLNSEMQNNQDDRFFKQMKIKVEKYMKVLKQKENGLRQQEISLHKRKLQIDEKELHLQRYVSILQNDLKKCQLDFPKIKKKAEEIKGENITADIMKNVEEKEVILSNQIEENSKEEKTIDKKEMRIKKMEIEVQSRTEKLGRKAIEINNNNNNEINNESSSQQFSFNQSIQTEAMILNPNSSQVQTSIVLQNTEKQLDSQMASLESTSDQNSQISNELDTESKAIEENEKQISEEEQRVEAEKQELIQQKIKIEGNIKQCKLDSQKNSQLFEEDQQKIWVCLNDQDQFNKDKQQIEQQIIEYEALQAELKQEKQKFEQQKQQLSGLKLINIQKHNPSLLPVFSEIRNEVTKEAFHKQIAIQIKEVQELAQNLAKQTKKLEFNKAQQVQLGEVQKIGGFIKRMSSKLNQILSQYPKNTDELNKNSVEIVKKIDAFYLFVQKLQDLKSSVHILKTKKTELVKLDFDCQKEQLRSQSFLKQKKKKKFQ